MTAHKLNQSTRGVTLIELMVALVLGLLLIAGVIQLFVGSRVTYMSTEGMSRVQESGRFALEFLKSPLRSAGTHGFCAGRVNIRNHLGSATGSLFDDGLAVMGWEYSGSGPEQTIVIDDVNPSETELDGNWSAAALPDGTTLALPDVLDGPGAVQVVHGSDILFVRRMESISGLTADSSVAANQENNRLISMTWSGTTVRQGEIVMVTNCSRGDIFQNGNDESAAVLNATGGNICPGLGFSPGNVSGSFSWSTPRDEAIQVLRARSEAYYIGFNSNRGEPGLYRFGFSDGCAQARHEEMVSGVENMQLLFGYSLPGTSGGDGQSVNWWLPAHQVPDWRLVVAVRVALSIRSPENADTAPVIHTFDLAGTDVVLQADQRRLRHTFSTTVALRNRGIVL